MTAVNGIIALSYYAIEQKFKLAGITVCRKSVKIINIKDDVILRIRLMCKKWLKLTSSKIR